MSGKIGRPRVPCPRRTVGTPPGPVRCGCPIFLGPTPFRCEPSRIIRASVQSEKFITILAGPRRCWRCWISSSNMAPRHTATDVMPANPTHAFDPNDDRIAHLVLHDLVDPDIGNDVRTGIWWKASPDPGKALSRHPRITDSGLIIGPDLGAAL